MNRWFSRIDRRSVLAVGIIGLAVLWVFVALSNIFPYGIIVPDTMTYYNAATNFHLLAPNPSDWSRTVPYGAVLHASTRFSAPSIAVYWVNALTFSANIILAYALTRHLFRSEKAAYGLSFLLLISECVHFRTIFYNAFVMSDSLYSNVLLMGTLLLLLGYVRERTNLIYAGFAIVGIAVFTRLVGISIFPLFIAFAIMACSRFVVNKYQMQWRHLSICLALLLGPTLLWSLHNAALYGYFRTSGYAGRNLLPRVLPLLSDADTVLPDPSKNKAFIQAVRATEKTFGKEYNNYSWSSSPEAPGPFAFLASLIPTNNDGPTDAMQRWVREHFDTDALAIQVALRIIEQHRAAYLKMVVRDYAELFDTRKWTRLRHQHELVSLAREEYRHVLELPVASRTALYPPNGTFDAQPSTSFSTLFFASVFQLPGAGLLRSFLSGRPFFVLVHGTFFAGILGVVLSMMNSCIANGLRKMWPAFVVVSTLFALAASQHLLTAAVELPIERYALPGEVPLHLMILVFLFVIAQLIIQSARTLRHARVAQVG